MTQTHWIAHIDMDCFFAACEVKRNPQLKGKPIIIGAPKNALRGVISTASYEARKFGIHSALPISKARERCPDGIYLKTDGTYYYQESKEIMTVLKQFSPIFKQVSVDEAYVDVTHLIKNNNQLDVARLIRKTIKEKTGYSCSIGIAKSRRVAKIASDYKKPAGITIVYNAKNFLKPLKIEKIPGVGKKSLPYFHKHGIRTIGDLANKNKLFILDTFGKHSFKLWLLANGLDESIILESEPEKSSSRETTFIQDVTNKELIKQKLKALCEKVYDDIKGLVYKTITIKIRYKPFITITRSITLKTPAQTIEEIIHAVKQLAKQIDFTKPIRLVGVKVSNFSRESSTQKSLAEFLSS